MCGYYTRYLYVFFMLFSLLVYLLHVLILITYIYPDTRDIISVQVIPDKRCKIADSMQSIYFLNIFLFFISSAFVLLLNVFTNNMCGYLDAGEILEVIPIKSLDTECREIIPEQIISEQVISDKRCTIADSVQGKCFLYFFSLLVFLVFN